jgi:hypothetical protein
MSNFQTEDRCVDKEITGVLETPVWLGSVQRRVGIARLGLGRLLRLRLRRVGQGDQQGVGSRIAQLTAHGIHDLGLCAQRCDQRVERNLGVPEDVRNTKGGKVAHPSKAKHVSGSQKRRMRRVCLAENSEK